MADVKSLSNMMKNGTVLAGGDCETCGKGGDTPKVVTRVAMQNIEKLNTPVQKVAASPKVAAGNPNLPELKNAPEPPAKRTLLSPDQKPRPMHGNLKLDNPLPNEVKDTDGFVSKKRILLSPNRPEAND